MSSKYDNFFLEKYIRGELSQAEREQFDRDLHESEPLRHELALAQSYFESIRAVPSIAVSEEFTDAVVRTIRARASRRTVSLATLTRGLFSRESIGVVVSMLVLAVLFRSQLTGVIHQLEPLTETQSIQFEQRSASADETVYSEEKDASYDEQSPVTENDALTKSVQEIAVVPTTKASADLFDQPKQNGVGAVGETQIPEAPAVAVQEISSAQPVIADQSYESLQAVRSEVSAEKSMPSAKRESEQKEYSKAKGVLAKKSVADNESLDMAQEDLQREESFPFEQFEATVKMGDTVVVTLPAKNLGGFVLAWKKTGGAVIDTVVAKRMTTVRVVR